MAAEMTESILKLQEENKRLRTAIEELSILNEISTAISSAQRQEDIIDLIVNKCVKHLKVEQGAVMLLNEADINKPFHTIMRKHDSVTNFLPMHFDSQLTGWMLKNKSPLMINDLQNDSRFSLKDKEKFPVNSLLCVPMNVKGKMTGVLSVFNKKTETGFDNNDLRLLGIIASQSGQIIENARLYEEEQSLIHLREEMRLAYEIQLNLLPKEIPKIEGYEIAGKSIPAKDVGGDYFDLIEIDEDKMAFCLGDISGKGIPAAILMANLQACLRGQAHLSKSCTESVSFTNDILYHNTSAEKFATLFYGILDFKNNEITYCNAGHNPPFLFSENKKELPLTPDGLIIGITSPYHYEEKKIPILPNDLLIIYSDGITEAVNSNGDEFAENRLKEIIANNRDENPAALLEIIFNTVKSFTGNVPQSDDMTLLILKKKK